jgi:hypothetical protein
MKYYLVTKESPYREQYRIFKANRMLVDKVVRMTLEQYGMNIEDYYVDSDSLGIIPADDSYEKYKEQFIEDDKSLQFAYFFKKDAEVYLSFLRGLRKRGLVVLDEPTFYTCTTDTKEKVLLVHTFFEYKGEVYARLDESTEVPVGFQEVNVTTMWE